MNQEKVYLADIAGYQEEKEEAVKLIDVLKNYELYRSKGASIPKGLLLCGMPGVGKTMFAKAISTEAGVPLYEFEAGESENEEATILSIKEVFKKAKETVPSIIFIDELDELVSSTDTSGFYGFQSDYSRKTLKSLLTEIDGIGSSDGVLVIATTNNRSTVPPALTRSGRLEKRITFRAPSLEDRAAIADLYLKKANVQGIKGLDIARKTKAFSGADIKSLINESIIVSVRRKENLSMGIINEVIPTIRFGEIKKEEKEEPKDSTCFHEIGHFLVQYGLNQTIGSLSVEKYGEILGRMEIDDYRPISSLRRKDDDDMSAEDILKSVSVDLGGMAGEEVFLGKRFCGSSSDISAAITKIDMLLRNAVFGFEYLPFFEVESQSSSGFSINRMLNKNDPGLRGRKYVEVLTKQYQAAKKYIEDLKPLGMMIYPLLKKRKSLSVEELTSLANRFQKEREKQQAVEEVHPMGNS